MSVQDFEETMNLVRQYRFPSLFINQFFPRPGTPAAKMQKVPAQEIKHRTKAISELFQSYRPYDHKVKCVDFCKSCCQTLISNTICTSFFDTRS